MSSIHKLGIIGIRSYGPEEEVVIKFFKPLTLILGKNGAGKTTIIEALKMAVSGSLPPNSQAGKTFICDPKLVNRPEVKAKIEIAFTAINAKKILGVRTFQLTNTAKKSEFRQMEQVLKAKDANGDIISVTQKCAEMDRQIPELLGVSDAVLNNVIFCHQEESLWPFGDTAKLKSIFDDLFDTTRYTNLLDNLKKVQKEYKKKAKEAAHAFEIEKKDFDILMRNQKEALNNMAAINTLQKQLDDNKKKITALKEKLKPVDTRLDILTAIRVVERDVKELIRQKEALLTYFEDNNVEMFTDNSSEELVKCKDEVVRSCQKKEEEIRLVEQKLEGLMKKKEDLQKELADLSNLNKDSTEAAFKTKDCRNKILEIVPMDLVGNETEMKLNEKVLSKAQAQLEAWEKEVRTESAKLQEQEQASELDLKNFNSGFASKEGQYMNYIKESQEIIEPKIQRLTEEIRQAGGSKNQGGRSAIDNELEKIIDKMENYKDSLGNYNDSVSQKTKELVEITEQMTKNAQNKEISIRYQDFTSLKKEFSVADQEYKANENELWMLSKNLSDISNLKYQADDSAEDLMQAIYAYESQLHNEKQTLEGKKERSNDTVKEINSFLHIKQTDYNEKMKFVEDFQERMRAKNLHSLIEGDADFISAYGRIKEKLKQAEKKETSMKLTAETLMRFYEKSKQSSKCAICTRKFSSEEEFKKLEAKCHELISKSSSYGESEQRTLEDIRNKKATFKGMKIEYEEYLKNKTAAEHLKRDMQLKEKERMLAQQQVNHLNTNISNIANFMIVIKDIEKAYEKLGKAEGDRTRYKTKIDDLLRNYPALRDFRGSGGLEDDKDLHERIEVLKADINRLRKLVDKADEEVQRLNLQKEEVEKRKMSQQKDVYDAENKVKELDAANKRKVELEELAKSAKAESEVLRNRIEGLEEKRTQVRNKIRALDEKNNTKVLRLKELIEEFRKVFEIWARSQDKKKKNHEGEAQKDKLGKEIQSAANDISALNERLQKLKDSIQEKEKSIKLLDDNIKLRELEKQIEDRKAEWASFDKVSKEIAENEEFNKQLQIEIDREIAKSYQSEGKSSVLKTNYETTMAEVKEKWGRTEKEYIEKLFESNINQHVVDDLDIYIDNLERALMIFHKQKMEEINKIIADLWIKTYQGTDIRKIEIKSDTEPNSRNKSFNYRIVFFNADGKELDMKGRCSMGQKVIASIVIRLGLAEAFCTNCGILALDEPTTNLDKDHIKKLAKELCNLIDERMNNENFQLILITHDKEFLREVSEHAEEYYRVFKDQQGFSKIERKRTSAL